MKIKKWNSSTSAWVQEYPEVNVDAIVATGTPSSTTYLRGDGTWATVTAGGGDITSVVAGTGLSGGGTSGDVTLNLDFSELTDITLDVSGTTEMIVAVGATEGRKALSEIKLSAFNNDAGWTSNIGDITSVVAGTGLTGGGTSGGVTLNVDTSTIATQTYVDTAVANLVDSSPAALDTLNELAAALGDDPNFATTVTNSIATKLPLAGGTMTGAINMGASDLKFEGADPGDIVWYDGSSSEIHRLWSGTNTLNYRTNAGTAYGLWHAGNLTNLNQLTNGPGYITGNQTITLSGDVSGSGTTSISVTVADDSHNHIIANVDGLQTALDGKASTSHNHDGTYAYYDHFRSLGTVTLNGGTTTSAIISQIEGWNAFDSYGSMFKGSWSYAGNSDLSDAGRLTELAGTSWLTWTDNSSDSTRGNITALVIAPNTGGSANGVFIYNDQGSGYSPGWREVWTSASDGSGSGLSADDVDGYHIVVGSTGTDTNTLYFTT